jgi:hypothetical protein
LRRSTRRRPPTRAPPARRPFRDNPVLILGSIVLLVAALFAMIGLADRTVQLSPDFLSEVVLYALTAVDVTMLAALLVLLGRNIVKLLVERRRGLPFARLPLFRTAALEPNAEYYVRVRAQTRPRNSLFALPWQRGGVLGSAKFTFLPR